MAGRLALPLIDLSSPDRDSSAKSIRKACVDHGFFYLVNHGIEESFFQQVLEESKKFFSLPLDEKMKLKTRKDNRGYDPLPSLALDSPPEVQGMVHEGFYVSSSKISYSQFNANQWPPEELLPYRKVTMESYYEQMLVPAWARLPSSEASTLLNLWAVGKKLISLMAFSLGLDDLFFEKIGALHEPLAYVRLLHYPGETFEGSCRRLGVSAHSDFGMITLLLTYGVRGLQICRDKDRCPQLWEDVPHVQGALVVNVGDMLERWTNCLFQSTLHRVLIPEQERYSVAFFLDGDPACMIECLESCCSRENPPRFPAIQCVDYLQGQISALLSQITQG